jgi:hypothetical protein
MLGELSVLRSDTSGVSLAQSLLIRLSGRRQVKELNLSTAEEEKKDSQTVR